jgi:hypothetical protein
MVKKNDKRKVMPDLQMQTLAEASQQKAPRKKNKATAVDKYHALKQKGERNVNRLRKQAEGYGGKDGIDQVIGHVKSMAEKHLTEALEKGEKVLRGKLHQGIEKTGSHVSKKISEKVKDKSVSNILQKGAKYVKGLAHKGLETASKNVKEFALKELKKKLS